MIIPLHTQLHISLFKLMYVYNFYKSTREKSSFILSQGRRHEKSFKHSNAT